MATERAGITEVACRQAENLSLDPIQALSLTVYTIDSFKLLI